MNWAIVPASPAHADLLAAIHRACFPPREAWAEDAMALQLAIPNTFGLLEPRGGLLIARFAADEAEVLTLAVLPGLRGQGLGRALLLDAMAVAQRHGAVQMLLEVAVDNVAARGLYDSAGFAQVGRRKQYYADGSDALVLRAALPPGQPVQEPTACPA